MASKKIDDAQRRVSYRTDHEAFGSEGSLVPPPEAVSIFYPASK